MHDNPGILSDPMSGAAYAGGQVVDMREDRD